MKKIIAALAIAMALSMAGLVLVCAEDKYTSGEEVSSGDFFGGFALTGAKDTHTVSGEVRHWGESDIYVCLHNQDTYRDFVARNMKLPPPEFVQIVKAGAAGKAPFAFTGVPKGEYLIIVFADENSNGKLDRDTLGMPLEPTCTHRTSEVTWNWHDQKFVVDQDKTGLVMSFYE